MSQKGIVLIGPSTYGAFDAAPLLKIQAAGYEIRRNPVGRKMSKDELNESLVGVVGIVAGLAKRFMLSEEAGAATTLYLAMSKEAAALNGQYLNEKQKVIMPSALAQSLQLQKSLWQQSNAAVEAFL